MENVIDKPVCLTKLEKINFNYVEPGWFELVYISPDWRVWENNNLQNICVEAAAEFFDIEPDKIAEAFYWAEDKQTNHKHLFVKLNMCSNDLDESGFKFIRNYMNGFVDAIGYT